MHTEHHPRRIMSIREFRRAVKSTMPLPVVVTSDGEPVFIVMALPVVQKMMEKVSAHQRCAER